MSGVVVSALSASCQKRKTRERNKPGSGGCAHEESRRRLSACGWQKQTCAKKDSKRIYLSSVPPTHHPSTTSCIAQSSRVMTLVRDGFLSSQRLQVAKHCRWLSEEPAMHCFSKALKRPRVKPCSQCWKKKGGKKVGRSGL